MADGRARRARPPAAAAHPDVRLASETRGFAASRGSRVCEVTRLGGGFADEPNTTPTRGRRGPVERRRGDDVRARPAGAAGRVQRLARLAGRLRRGPRELQDPARDGGEEPLELAGREPRDGRADAASGGDGERVPPGLGRSAPASALRAGRGGTRRTPPAPRGPPARRRARAPPGGFPPRRRPSRCRGGAPASHARFRHARFRHARFRPAREPGRRAPRPLPRPPARAPWRTPPRVPP